MSNSGFFGLETMIRPLDGCNSHGAIKPFDNMPTIWGGGLGRFSKLHIYPGFNRTRLPSKLQHFLFRSGIKHDFLICDVAKRQKTCGVSLLILSIFTCFELFGIGMQRVFLS